MPRQDSQVTPNVSAHALSELLPATFVAYGDTGRWSVYFPLTSNLALVGAELVRRALGAPAPAAAGASGSVENMRRVLGVRGPERYDGGSGAGTVRAGTTPIR